VAALLREAFGNDAPVVSHTPAGAPVLEECNCSVSISHCAGAVVLALDADGRQVGIDAECRCRGEQLRRVAHKFLAPCQMETWGVSTESLLRAWTIKEAIYKAALTPGLALCDIPLPSSTGYFEAETAKTAVPTGIGGKNFLLIPIEIGWFDGAVTLAVEKF